MVNGSMCSMRGRLTFLDHAGWQQVPLQMLPWDRSMRWSWSQPFVGDFCWGQWYQVMPCFCEEDGSLQTAATSNRQTTSDYQHFKEFSHAQVSAVGRWGEASSSHQVTGSIWKLFVHFVVASRCIGGTVKPGSISTFGLRRNAPEIVWTHYCFFMFFCFSPLLGYGMWVRLIGSEHIC